MNRNVQYHLIDKVWGLSGIALGLFKLKLLENLWHERYLGLNLSGPVFSMMVCHSLKKLSLGAVLAQVPPFTFLEDLLGGLVLVFASM